MLIITFS